MQAMDNHHLVVIGGGFAGLQLVNDLKGTPTRITLIDRRNHHLFQPLLYQVATTLLATSEIAWPIRSLYRDRPDYRHSASGFPRILDRRMARPRGNAQAPSPFVELPLRSERISSCDAVTKNRTVV